MSTSPQVKRALATLLRNPGNSLCADCKAQSHPRWASWSLGVFICIKCAGVHRSLGTHISKVKSVDLDTWKEEHIVMLVKMKNNQVANLLYESKLPTAAKGAALNDIGQIQLFIKGKYEYKKWMGDKSSIELNNTNENDQFSNNAPQPRTCSQIGENDLLSSSAVSASKTAETNSISSSSSLLDLQSFDPLKSGTGPSRPQNTPINNANTKPNSIGQRPDLKKSILSLYAKPSNAASTSQNSFSDNNKSSSSISLASVYSMNNNNMNMGTNSSNNVNGAPTSSYNIDDDELLKNVWTN